MRVHDTASVGAQGIDRNVALDVLGLIELLRPPAWHADALCVEYPGVNFFPELGETSAAAKAVCRRCAVAADCLSAGLSERHGVWGGTVPVERRLLRNRPA